MNKVILMGRMTKAPELKNTQSGTAVCSFSLAVNRRFKDKNGNYPTDFINCVSWQQTAEFIAKYFDKGSMIAIVGNIQTRTYDDAQGKRHYVTEVIVDEAYFFGGKENNVTQKPHGNANQLPLANEVNGFAPFEDDEDDLPF